MRPNPVLAEGLALTLRAAMAVVGALPMFTQSFPGRTGLAGLVGLFVGTSLVTAQDALETAIRGDRSEQARQLAAAPSDTAPERIKAGPLEFNVGLSYGLEYTDNVRNRSSPREEDIIQRPQLNFSGLLPITDTGRLTLGIGIGYADYFKHNDLDRLYFSPDSELAYDFSVKDVRFTLFDSFDYSYDVESVGALSGVSQFPHFQNTAGVRALWSPSEWSYQAGYSHQNYITQRGSAKETDFGYLDRSSEQVFGRVAYSFAPGTRAGVEVSSALTDYSSAVQADNVSASIGPFVEWQVLEALTVTLRGGFTHYSFDSTPGSTNAPIRPERPSYTLDSYYAGFGVNHRLTDFITHGISVNHSIQPGVNQGGDYTETTTAGYQISWTLTQNTTVGGSLNYSRGSEKQTQIPQDGVIVLDGLTLKSEDYDTYGAGVNASYRFTRQASVSATYNHNRRASSGGAVGRDYFVNRVALNLRYQF